MAWQFCSSFHTLEHDGNHWCLWELRWGKKKSFSLLISSAQYYCCMGRSESPTTSPFSPGPILGCKASDRFLPPQAIKITFKLFLFLTVFCRVALPKNGWMDCALQDSTGQHPLTTGRKEDPRDAGRKEIQEEWERVSGIRYHTPKTQLIYWMILQTHLKLAFSFKMKLAEWWKYKDLLEHPAKTKDARLSIVGGVWSLFSSLRVRTHGASCPEAGKAPHPRIVASLAPQTGSGIPSAGAGGRRAERARGLHRPAYGPPVRSPVSILEGGLSRAIPQRDDGNHVLCSKHEEI